MRVKYPRTKNQKTMDFNGYCSCCSYQYRRPQMLRELERTQSKVEEYLTGECFEYEDWMWWEYEETRPNPWYPYESERYVDADPVV